MNVTELSVCKLALDHSGLNKLKENIILALHIFKGNNSSFHEKNTNRDLESP